MGSYARLGAALFFFYSQSIQPMPHAYSQMEYILDQLGSCNV
jgi:hypothetical protein